MQTRWQSFLEAWANIAIGAGVALVTQLAVFPLFGIHIPLSHDVYIMLIFTVVSLVRSYALRRLFNWIHSAPMPTRGCAAWCDAVRSRGLEDCDCGGTCENGL